MSGSPVSDFADFVEGTGPTYVTGPKDIVNEAVKNTYYFGRLMQGDVNSTKVIQGGADIRESLVFRDNGSAETYFPGQNHEWKNPQRLEKVRAYWRFVMAHMSWTEQELLLNEKLMYGDSAARFHQYVDLRNEKEMIMWTSKWNFLEDLLWAEPDTATMEGQGAGFSEPYSIPVFINEDTNGLFARNGTTWTTIHDVNVTASTTDGKYEPQVNTYSSTAVAPADNILAAFDEMWMDVHFEQPAMHKQYWEDPRLNKQMILTTKVGRAAAQGLLRAGQDHYVAGGQDAAYPNPIYNGIPIPRVSTLETATLYDDGSSDNTTEALADATAVGRGPRFYWVNGNYLYPVFHSERMFMKHEVTKHHNVPDTWVCPVATWYNLLCPSRQRQGIVKPAAGNTLYY